MVSRDHDPDEPIPIENLLPLRLIVAYQTDEIVNGSFTTSCQRRQSREDALIDAVLHLVSSRQALIEHVKELSATKPPAPIIIRQGFGP